MTEITTAYLSIALAWACIALSRGRPQSLGQWLGLALFALGWPLVLGWLFFDVAVKRNRPR